MQNRKKKQNSINRNREKKYIEKKIDLYNCVEAHNEVDFKNSIYDFFLFI